MKSTTQRLEQRSFSKNTRLQLTLLAVCALIGSTQCQGDIVLPSYPQLNENQVYEGNSLGDKQTAYYYMQVTDTFYSGQQSLAVKVIPEAFDSDPDIFISKNNTKPSSSYDSQWQCAKKGGDTCVLKKNEISIGDILYIAVRCLNPCNYTILTDYFVTTTIQENVRTQVRLDGHSSSLFEYYVPSDSSAGFTRTVTFSIESEDTYNPIDLYFSLDDTINIIEERKIENILQNGVGTYFTENDQGWCTRCFVYFYIEVIIPGRYYVYARSGARNPVITQNIKSDRFVNLRQQDCFQYYVANEWQDVYIYVSNYNGEADLYVAGGRIPTGPTDSAVLTRAERGSQRLLILTTADKTRYGYRTGLFQICLYGYDEQSSVLLLPTEGYDGGRYDISEPGTVSLNIEARTSVYFRYSTPNLAQKCTVSVSLQGMNLALNQIPPRIFYKVCPSSNQVNCWMNATELNGASRSVSELSVNTYSGQYRTAIINHDPKVCPNPGSCAYLFAVYNDQTVNPRILTTFSVLSSAASTQSISIDQTYKDTFWKGGYRYYQLLPGNSEAFAFLDEITIKVENLIGDADLVASVTNPYPKIDVDEFESRQSDTFESIILKKTGNFSLNRPIYIGVYASSLSIFLLSFDVKYSMNYNIKLEKATPLVESQPSYVYLSDETEEKFFSFQPWWAGFENRTMVMFAEVVFNKVFFYMKFNDFPQFYTTEWQDVNDVIALQPYNSGYDLTFGYFIRARPDFALYDLISKRQYVFNMYAFSQMQNDKYIDLQHNEQILGYANSSSVYYRHFIIERNATYNIQLQPIQGNPSLLIKLSNSPIRPSTLDVNSWDLRRFDTNLETQTISLPEDDRISYDSNCNERSGYYLYGGNTLCTIYIAAECQGQCLFRIKVWNQNREHSTTVPAYITETMYTSGAVTYGQVKYYYFPVTKTTGDMAIMLNKTGPIGKNGDSVLVLAFQSDSLKSIDQWTYPKSNYFSVASVNNNPTQPEIIEVCPRVLNEKCGNNSCVLMLGVIGSTRNLNSNYRLMAYTSKTRLYDKTPTYGNIAKAGQYNYYWFSSNVSVINPQTFWSYTVAVNVDTPGMDVDLYVSALDGRFPVTEDYDYKSDNFGPDDVYMKSTDAFWKDNGYNKSVGIIFVVGIKALTDNVNYTVVMVGPNKLEVPFTALTTGVQYTRTLPGNNTPALNVQYFRWFNWGFKDFRINMDVSLGQITGMVNFISEESYQNTGYLAVPYNVNNSRYSVFLATSQSAVQRVYKDEYGSTSTLFCYYCQYFIAVTTNTSAQATYRLSVSQMADVGEEVTVMTVGTSVQVTLPAIAAVAQRKFVLDNKEPFNVVCQVNTGQVNVYVGLYPNNAISRFSWSGSGNQGSTVNIPVKMTDQSFKLGAFYYITLQAVSGRTVVSLSIQQRKKVLQLQNNAVFKQTIWNNEERLKLYYFQIPYRINVKISVNITALTEDFYPTVLVYKNLLGSAVNDPTTELTYPTYAAYNVSMGDNFTDVANKNQFSFQWRDVGNTTYSYLTLAVYSWSYGMTDRRKAEFKISATYEAVTLSQEHPSSGVESYYTYNEETAAIQQENKESLVESMKNWMHKKYEAVEDQVEKIFLSE